MVKQTTSSTPKRKYTIKDQEKYSASRTKHVKKNAAHALLSLHSNGPSISREDAAESMLRLHGNTHSNTQNNELFPNPYASPYGINIPLSRYVIPPPPDYPPPPVPNYPSSFSRGGKTAKRRSRRRKNKR